MNRRTALLPLALTGCLLASCAPKTPPPAFAAGTPLEKGSLMWTAEGTTQTSHAITFRFPAELMLKDCVSYFTGRAGCRIDEHSGVKYFKMDDGRISFTIAPGRANADGTMDASYGDRESYALVTVNKEKP